MKKLVIATPLYPPEIGGPATYVRELEAGLPSKGIELEIVKFSDVRHLPKLIRHYAYYRKLLAALKYADGVLALDPVSVGYPAHCAAKKLGKPLIVKIVGDYAWEQGRQRFGITETIDEFVKRKEVPFFVRLLRKIQRRVAKDAARIIVPSEYLKKIVQAWSIPPEKIEVIYNAVSVEHVGNVPGTVEQLPRPLVVTAGRLVPWKHIDGIIDAVGFTDASLAIVGDGPLRHELTERADEKLSNRYIATGALSHPDTLAVIQSADVFVLNSSYEGFSHLLVEALSLGVPSIAPNVGGNSEIIEHGRNGLLIEDDLLPTLGRLLTDETLRQRLGSHAKESAQSFKRGVMIEKTFNLLNSL